MNTQLKEYTLNPSQMENIFEKSAANFAVVIPQFLYVFSITAAVLDLRRSVQFAYFG